MNFFGVGIFVICLFGGVISEMHSPVIGIITLRYDESLLSYVNGEYVKLMEISGAQVVPIFAFNST